MQPLPPFTHAALHGDSGSVMVDLASSNVVALIFGIDSAKPGFAYGTPILDVVNKLHITIIPTDPALTYEVGELDEDGSERFARMARQSAFGAMADRLGATDRGRELVALVMRHHRECIHLVSHERAGMVAWQRNRGPTFLAALARSAKEPIYRIPREIGGVTRKEAVLAMQTLLETHGSESLRADLRSHGAELAGLLARSETAAELIDTWEAAG